MTHEVTNDEWDAHVEEQLQRYLGMSLAEFKEQVEAGTLPDDPLVGHMLVLTGAGAWRP